MQVIPVIDLMDGQVVRGVAGRRAEYRQIESRIATDPRPATVARALVEQFGFDTVYVADLDAITRTQPDVHSWTEIANAGLKLWLDAGVGSIEASRQVVAQLQRSNIDFRLIVGLESLISLDELAAISQAWDSPIVSLDLKAGTPLTRIESLRAVQPAEIAKQLHNCGIEDLIVLDLADVGTGQGISTIDLCREIAARFRGCLVAGGGVRGIDDLHALTNAGCHAALVASALHDGRLAQADIERARLLSLDSRPLTPRRQLG